MNPWYEMQRLIDMWEEEAQAKGPHSDESRKLGLFRANQNRRAPFFFEGFLSFRKFW